MSDNTKDEQLEPTTSQEQGGLDDDGEDEITLKAVGEDGKDGKSFTIKKNFANCLTLL